jgi:hypothetical protein
MNKRGVTILLGKGESDSAIDAPARKSGFAIFCGGAESTVSAKITESAGLASAVFGLL